MLFFIRPISVVELLHLGRQALEQKAGNGTNERRCLILFHFAKKDRNYKGKSGASGKPDHCCTELWACRMWNFEGHLLYDKFFPPFLLNTHR